MLPDSVAAFVLPRQRRSPHGLESLAGGGLACCYSAMMGTPALAYQSGQ